MGPRTSLLWLPAIIYANVDAQAPIHLIGHSAGGFVVGEAGYLLTYDHPLNPFYHDLQAMQVTLLDTPLPWAMHVSRYPDPGYMDRIISSLWGTLLAAAPINHQYYAKEYRSRFGETALDALRAVHPLDDHGYAHDWYTDTIQGSYADGFNYSPLLDNGFYGGNRLSSMSALLSSDFSLAEDGGTTNYSIGGFSTFGSVTEAAGVYTIFESANAGIYATVEFPTHARDIRFSHQFISAGDGDFLSVHVGSNRTVYVGADTEVSRSNAVEAAAFVREFAGTTNLVTFKLVSRGVSNAVLRLSDIRMEFARDSDGDGIGDDNETGTGMFISEYDAGTDPALPDTDDDGMKDGDEIVADTVPTDTDSCLRLTRVGITDGHAVVSWQGGILATQYLERTTLLASSGTAWRAIFTNSPPTATETNFVDAIGTNRVMFYRIKAAR